jgi:thiol-disulfide isomerase/thioredoxin
MKKSLLIILYAFLAQLMMGQTGLLKDNSADSFCRMVKANYSLDALSFNSQFSEKQVFENDTVTTFAQVILKKKGTTISFLQIIPEAGNKELLFFNDSAWLADHSKKTILFLGTGSDALTHNHLSEFFPFSIYNIDTTICLVEPYWKTIEETQEYTVISLDISDAPEELSDFKVEFTIGNSDFLLHKFLKEAVYMKADKFVQEVNFSRYSFPDANEVRIPDYYSTYVKDCSLVEISDIGAEKKSEEIAAEIYIKDIELFDLSGNPFSLPQDGLIFFDLWYVGCPPCMKSAPVIEKLYREYKDKVYFFSINETDQDTAKISRFKDKMGITFPVLLGGREKLAGKLNGGKGYPVFILMDAESGKVLWNKQGYSENLEELITDAIRQNF